MAILPLLAFSKPKRSSSTGQESTWLSPINWTSLEDQCWCWWGLLGLSCKTSSVCLSEGMNRKETGQDSTSPFMYLFFLNKFCCVYLVLNSRMLIDNGVLTMERINIHQQEANFSFLTRAEPISSSWTSLHPILKIFFMSCRSHMYLSMFFHPQSSYVALSSQQESQNPCPLANNSNNADSTSLYS